MIEDYWSSTLGNIYLEHIEKDMSKFSEIAKEIGTTPENVLLYIIVQKLEDVRTEGIYDMPKTLDTIKDSLDTIIDAIEGIKSKD